MLVRAKMSCGQKIVGVKGCNVYMSAVYEGSAELQKITENAIFGDATPNGNLLICGFEPIDRGMGLRSEAIVPQEEYYIDLIGPKDRFPDEPPDGAMFAARLVFRSEVDTNMPDNPIQFRHVLLDPLGGTLDMGIRNPHAIAWLDMHPIVYGLIRLARGRKSDVEIALREAEVEKAAGYARDEYGKRSTDRWSTVDPTHSLDEHVARRTEHYRHKLAIARGEL